MGQGYTKGIPLDSDGTLSANSDFLAPTQKAVKTYVDTGLATKQATLTGDESVLNNGIHYPFAKSGDYINLALTSDTKTTVAGSTNRIDLSVFYPAQDFSISEFAIYCSTDVIGAFYHILVYDDLNGVPNNLLYESGNLDCSTIGLKSEVNAFNFARGVKYWVGTHSSSTASLHAISVNALIPLSTRSTLTSYNTAYRVTSAFGTAPSPITGGTLSFVNHSQVLMLIA
jgi:hypothetical protein